MTTNTACADANPRDGWTTIILSKVAEGNADAGVVYVIDVRADGGRTQGVVFPDGGLTRFWVH